MTNKREHTLGSQPIQEELYQPMQQAADALDGFFNQGCSPGDKRKVGFVLMVFNFDGAEGKDPNSRCNYISTARREDVICLLKEQLAYFEGMPENECLRG
jgi:hypothetical protein